MKSFLSTGMLVVMLSLLPMASVTLRAQEASSQSSVAAEDRRALQQARLAELRARIEAVKHQKIQQQLGLDDEAARKFFEVYRPAEKEIQDIVRERNEELRKLGQMMKSGTADAQVDPEMQRIRELNQKIESRALQLDTDLKGQLSATQRAKLLVFEHQFNQRVREQIAKRRIEKRIAPKLKENKELRQKLKELRENQKGARGGEKKKAGKR